MLNLNTFLCLRPVQVAAAAAGAAGATGVATTLSFGDASGVTVGIGGVKALDFSDL